MATNEAADLPCLGRTILGLKAKVPEEETKLPLGVKEASRANLRILGVTTTPCRSGAKEGDEATAFVHIHSVMVPVASYVGVKLATADLGIDPNTLAEVACKVTIFKIKVTTFADTVGPFRDHERTTVSA